MRFKERYPDYMSYADDPYYCASVPMGMLGPLKGYIMRYCDNADSLKGFCQHIASLIPCEPTNNWGWDWLVSDLDDLLRKLAQSKFHKFMEGIQYFVENWVRTEDLEDLNDIFEEYDFGYTMFYGGPSYGGEWNIRDEPHQAAKSIEAAIEVVEDISLQSKKHLEKAKEHVLNAVDDRARKDALRDALSAMESAVKVVGDDKDFDTACQKIHNNALYGSKEISREPNRLWHWIHQLYPDVRHGTQQASNISADEACFWIDRILAITVFITRTYKKIRTGPS